MKYLPLRLPIVTLIISPLLCNATALRDPTQPTPLTELDGADTGWVLESIFIKPNSKSAFLNGQLVTVGDEIAGAKVIAITRDHIKLHTNTEEITIPLVNYSIKKSS